MTTRRLLSATLLASLCLPALAEDLDIQNDDGARRIVIRQAAVTPPSSQHAGLRAGDSASLNSAMLRIIGDQVVKGAPYSAEAVSERLQHLSDGNQILVRSRAMHYRDSAGRTRTEVYNDQGGVDRVIINDPVAGTRWTLDPERKTARASGITSDAERARADEARQASAQARVEAARARAEAHRERAIADGARRAAEQQRTVADEARRHADRLRQEGRLTGPTHVIVKEVGRGDDRPDVRVRIAQPAPVALPAARAISAQIAPMIVGASIDNKWSSKAVTRDLGLREVAGIRVQGQQRSYAIPAGDIGNRDPITVSSESWTSPELQILVQQKHSDPRSGDLVYRLEGLKRTEPAAALFSPPPDYTVRGRERAD